MSFRVLSPMTLFSLERAARRWSIVKPNKLT